MTSMEMTSILKAKEDIVKVEVRGWVDEKIFINLSLLLNLLLIGEVK